MPFKFILQSLSFCLLSYEIEVATSTPQDNVDDKGPVFLTPVISCQGSPGASRRVSLTACGVSARVRGSVHVHEMCSTHRLR